MCMCKLFAMNKGIQRRRNIKVDGKDANCYQAAVRFRSEERQFSRIIITTGKLLIYYHLDDDSTSSPTIYDFMVLLGVVYVRICAKIFSSNVKIDMVCFDGVNM